MARFKFDEDDLNDMIVAEVQGKPPKPSIKGFKDKFGIKDNVDITNPLSVRKPMQKPVPGKMNIGGV